MNDETVRGCVGLSRWAVGGAFAKCENSVIQGRRLGKVAAPLSVNKPLDPVTCGLE